MIKVLIVDDEVLARVGIKSFLDWNRNGFQIVGECDNGQKALELTEELCPDIIISDVQMPIMNGIELIKAVKANNSSIKFIMLSSYDDFELVKEAMKAGAEDYILKLQMEASELLDLLLVTKEIIERDNCLINNSSKSSVHSSKDMIILKDRFIKDLIYGKKFTDDEYVDNLKKYSITLPKENLLCLVIKIDENSGNVSYRDTVFRTSVRNIISENIRNYGSGQVVHCEPDMYSVICSLDSFNSKEELKDGMDRMTNSIRKFIKNSANVSIVIGVSSVYSGFQSIRGAYLESMEAISFRESYPKGSIIHYNQIQKKKSEVSHNSIILRAKQYVHDNIESNITLKSISEYLELSSSYFSRLFSKATGQVFVEYVTENKMDIAKHLIRNTNKKIYEIAEEVGYENVHYFSRVFKKTVGISPIEYRSGKCQESAN